MRRALVHLDFINQRYFWNGRNRFTSEFTTYTLNGSTFGPHGLTPSATIDVTLATADFGFAFPCTVLAQLFPTSNPGTNRVPVNIDDGTANECLRLRQATDGVHAFFVTDGGASVASIGTTAMVNGRRNGFAAAVATNDVRYVCNGKIEGAADTSASMPTVTTLRIARRETADSEYIGAEGQVIVLPYAMTDAELVASSHRLSNLY